VLISSRVLVMRVDVTALVEESAIIPLVSVTVLLDIMEPNVNTKLFSAKYAVDILAREIHMYIHIEIRSIINYYFQD
jgi:hypothetical protein